MRTNLAFHQKMDASYLPRVSLTPCDASLKYLFYTNELLTKFKILFHTDTDFSDVVDSIAIESNKITIL